jgi:hypothetical protein
MDKNMWGKIAAGFGPDGIPSSEQDAQTVIKEAQERAQTPTKLAFPGLVSMAILNSAVLPNICFRDEVTGYFMNVGLTPLPGMVPAGEQFKEYNTAVAIRYMVPVGTKIDPQDFQLAMNRTVLQAVFIASAQPKALLMVDKDNPMDCHLGPNWLEYFGLIMFMQPASSVRESARLLKALIGRYEQDNGEIE